jgi:hypothetical protein
MSGCERSRLMSGSSAYCGSIIFRVEGRRARSAYSSSPRTISANMAGTRSSTYFITPGWHADGGIQSAGAPAHSPAGAGQARIAHRGAATFWTAALLRRFFSFEQPIGITHGNWGKTFGAQVVSACRLRYCSSLRASTPECFSTKRSLLHDDG